MRAIIRMLSPIPNRKVLFDIGIAGPLSGLVVGLPILALGLALSPVKPLAGVILQEGNSLAYLLLKWVIKGPIPAGSDVMLHPIAWAGWAGLLVTALNLIPAGQLDGGHVIYTLLGKRARVFVPFILLALLVMGMVWSGWWLWAFIIFLLGRIYAEPVDQITTLNPRRQALAILGLLIFVLVFIPMSSR